MTRIGPLCFVKLAVDAAESDSSAGKIQSVLHDLWALAAGAEYALKEADSIALRAHSALLALSQNCSIEH
jgi:hypothetical protein